MRDTKYLTDLLGFNISQVQSTTLYMSAHLSRVHQICSKCTLNPGKVGALIRNVKVKLQLYIYSSLRKKISLKERNEGFILHLRESKFHLREDVAFVKN